MARRVRQTKISVIDQAILNAQGDIAQVRADFGDAIADAVAITIGLEKDIAVGGPLAAYLRHARESLIAELVAFADIDPNKVEDVRRAQSAIREYGRLLDWVATTVEIGTGEKAHMEAGAGSELKDD